MNNQCIYPLRRLRLPSADDIYPYLKEIDASRWYSNFGPLTLRFQYRLAEHFAVQPENLVLVSNATIGLVLALQNLKVDSGSYCAIPTITFPATVEAVLFAGLKPIFVDVDPVSFTVCEKKLRQLKEDLGSKLTAVMPVSFFGRPLDSSHWLHLQKELELSCVCDSAWAFDSLVASTLANVVSLHATKPIGIGEGGLVVSKDSSLINDIKERSNFGIRSDRSILRPGINGKMSEYAAAVGLAALDQWSKKRVAIERVTSIYKSHLARVDNIRLFPSDSENWVSGTICVQHMHGDCEELLAYLNSHGIEARFWWGKPSHLLPAFSLVEKDDQKNAEKLYKSTFNLPFDEEMEEKDIEFIVNTLNDGIHLVM